MYCRIITVNTAISAISRIRVDDLDKCATGKIILCYRRISFFHNRYFILNTWNNRYFYRMPKRLFFHWIIILLFSPISWEQQLMFGNVGVHKGLPATEVYKVFEDSRGYVWAFTEYGMVKHNGSVFVPVCTNIPFRERVVYAVGESPGGELYFANSQAAIYRIRNDSAFRIPGTEKISSEILAASEVIMDFSVDEKTAIHFSTFSRSYTISGNDQGKRASAGKHRGNYYMELGGTAIPRKSLQVKDRSGRICYSFPYSQSAFDRFGCLEKGSDVYVAFGNRVMLLKKNRLAVTATLPSEFICFNIALNGHVWVGLSDGGAYELDSELKILITIWEL